MIGLEMKWTVKANGNEIRQSISLISGFAQQQEIFVPTLTVDDYLMIQICVLASVLVEQSATSCGLFLACLFETTSVAIAFAVPASGLFALLSGLYGNTSNFPVYIRWMQWTSWFRYGFEGLVVNQWSRVDNSSYTNFYRDVILDQVSFKHDNYQLDVIGLSSIVVFFYLAGFIALLVRIRLSR
ncbi:hypothetical protein CRE_06940 [Caenorhabditis remanei]|uniref:ABC-2 type transporter transmembrane domain-containing protein n=1 Tax=Caenorhabditis remanei TaxID=31234 RepID=E3N6P7_CAERE|nr:hypothetical protein CRE_06940 [Caenorhabditis remanei]